MEFRAVWSIAVLFSVSIFADALAADKAVLYGMDKRRVADEYIVVLKPGATAKQHMSSIVSKSGGAVKKQFGSVLNGFSARMTPTELEKLRENPLVAYVEANGYVSAHATTQNNPTWGLDRVDQRSLPLNSTFVYDRSGSGVHAYILDSGVDYTHPEFKNPVRTALGYNALAGTPDFDKDCNGHGTHVAGILAGNTYGVAKGVTIHSVRVLGCEAEGTVADLIDGINWIVSNHQKPAVVNMSIGYPKTYTSASQAILNAVNSHGIPFVVSAGNYADDACSYGPGFIPELITVGASDRYDNMWVVDNDGSNNGACVDLFAPGVNITSAQADLLQGTAPPSCHPNCQTDAPSYTQKTGTSMASPFVAGILASYLQEYPQSSPADLQAFVKANATSGKLSFPSNVRSGTPNLLAYSRFDVAPPPPSLDVLITAEYMGCTLGSPRYFIQLSTTAISPVFDVDWRRNGSAWYSLYDGTNAFVNYRGESGASESIRVRVTSAGQTGDFTQVNFTSPSCGGTGGLPQ